MAGTTIGSMPNQILGLFCGIAAFIWALDYILAPTVFKCDKLKNVCYRESRHFWSHDIKRENLCALSDVHQANVQPSKPPILHCFSTVLELTNGTSVSIFKTRSGFLSNPTAKHKKDAEKINAFLRQPQQELCITDFELGFAILLIFMGIAFTVVPLICMITLLNS